MTTDPQPYIVPNEWEHAERRLRCLEATYDPITFRHLDQIGVEPGWKCLELGAGAGSVSRRLLELVGEGGRVVALDMDPRFVVPLAESNANFEVHQLDLNRDPVPGDGYDLIHTRALLMHLPNRGELLHHLVTLVKPGGWLLIEEADTAPTRAAEGPWRQMWEQTYATFGCHERGGIDYDFGRRVPARLAAEGCTIVQANLEAPMFPGGTLAAEVLKLSFIQVTDQLVGAGLPGHIFKEAIAEMDDPERWFPSLGLVSTSARRPPA